MTFRFPPSYPQRRILLSDYTQGYIQNVSLRRQDGTPLQFELLISGHTTGIKSHDGRASFARTEYSTVLYEQLQEIAAAKDGVIARLTPEQKNLAFNFAGADHIVAVLDDPVPNDDPCVESSIG